MCVDRAVEKLRALLARRGVISTAAALALVLTNQAVVAAPVGLATTVTGTALAGLAVTGGTVATFTFMSLTKLQIGVASAILVAGVGGYFAQEKNNQSLRTELAGMQRPAGEIARLQEANRQLVLAASEAATLRVNDSEFARLREESSAVQNSLETNTVAARRAAAVRQAAPKGEIFDVSQLDQKPRMSRAVSPDYPNKMFEAGITGNVTVEFVIDAAGKVTDARILRSSHPEFEAPTLTAVSKWQFDPGQKNGRLVNTRATQLIKFNLGDETSNSPPDWF